MVNQKLLVEAFLRTTEGFGWTQEVASNLLHPDYVQIELPNLLNRNGQTSDIAQTIARNGLAKTILSSQTYTVTSMVEAEHSVVLEAKWSGEMQVDAGPLRAGQRLDAFFCMVFDFREGRIHRVRNYDCFAPF